ncbi:MAG: hypothetical protein UZ18_ATM001000335 [Armatimonadetes bacterium OLB18]|nr:MAG: hypothetical protein UZ18_ATM001000335 [Armatimonadetes bacterium OLB18]
MVDVTGFRESTAVKFLVCQTCEESSERSV